MQEPKAWDDLLGALIEICERLLKRMSRVPKKHVPVRIIDAMFLTSVDTLRAVRLLYGSRLPIQAQALIRILLEVRIESSCSPDRTRNRSARLPVRRFSARIARPRASRGKSDSA